jgi:Fic family protein
MSGFSPSFTLTPRMQRQLVAIDRCVGFLEAVELDANWRHDLRDSARLQDAVSSLQIEGSSLTIERAFRLLTEPPARDLGEAEREFVNYLAAFDAIDGLRGDKAYTVSHRDLLNLHGIIVQEVRGGFSNAGRFRDGEVEVVVHHRPPPAEQVRAHVEALMDWLDRVKTHPTPAQLARRADDPWVHPVIAAGIAQHRLVWIHPFMDGNGRTARMFTTMLLYQRGYDFKYLFDLSTYYNRDRDRYYGALRSADAADEYTPWLEYFLGGFALQLFAIKARAVKLSRGIAREATEEDA